MSRPSFQFYPDDWQTDVGLRRCSPAARGVWMDLICLMHQGEPYGYLTSKTGPLPIKFLAQTAGISSQKLAILMLELEQNGVFSRDETGAIFSRRMVKDERVRLARSTGGGKSIENPNVPRAKVKDIHKGYPSRMVQVSPAHAGDEEEAASSLELVLKGREEKISFQKDHDALWEWFKGVYPGELIQIRDAGIFRSVIGTFEDIRDMRVNLPLWMESRRWKEGYPDSAKNFLTDRIFKERPKVRAPPKPASQPKQGSLMDRTVALWEKRLEEGKSPL